MLLHQRIDLFIEKAEIFPKIAKAYIQPVQGRSVHIRQLVLAILEYLGYLAMKGRKTLWDDNTELQQQTTHVIG